MENSQFAEQLWALNSGDAHQEVLIKFFEDGGPKILNLLLTSILPADQESGSSLAMVVLNSALSVKAPHLIRSILSLLEIAPKSEATSQLCMHSRQMLTAYILEIPYENVTDSTRLEIPEILARLNQAPHHSPGID